MANEQGNRSHPTTEGGEGMNLLLGITLVMIVFYLVLVMEEKVNGK